MSWLFPLYLAGAAAVLVPLILHLRRQPPQDRVPFSSLMFLEASEQQPTRRRRLEHWLLLLLRCLVLLALAAMFSRPLWRTEGAAAGGDAAETLLVLVDRSASMRRADLWEQAVRAVRAELAGRGAEDRVAVGVFDGELRPLWSFAEDAADGGVAREGRVMARLNERGAGWGSSALGAALVESLGWLEAPQLPVRRRVVVISDFQEGAELEPLRQVVWPEDLPLVRRAVGLGTEDPGNLTLQWVGTRDEEAAGAGQAAGSAGTGSGLRRVRVRSAAGTPDTAFELAWDSASGQPLGGENRVVTQSFLPGGATRVLEAPPRPGAAADGPGAVLKLTGDRFDFDNRAYLAPEKPREVAVWVAGAEADAKEASHPTFYLKRVLQPTAAIRPVLTWPAAGRWAEAGAGAMRPQVLVLPGKGAAAAPADAQRWRQELEAGAVGIVVAEGAAEAAFLQALVPEAAWTVTDAEPSAGGYAMLGELNPAHPLLRPFADGRLQDFSKVRFWRHRRVGFQGEAVSVLARFDQGDPALLAVAVGRGHLLVLASGWHPADSQLALSTKFVPLWFGWLAAAGYAHQEPVSFEVGEVIPRVGLASGRLIEPGGVTRVVAAGEPLVVEQPGLYEWREDAASSAAAAAGGRVFAVQVPGAEGRVEVMPPTRLAEAGLRLLEAAGNPAQVAAVDPVTAERRNRAAEESQQRAWWWLLLALLALALGETWLAGRPGTARPEAV
jgi:hypothetical protein